MCDGIIYVLDIVSAKMTNTIVTIAASTVSINCHSKKVTRKIDCYILHTFLLVIMLLFIIAIICYHYAKHMFFCYCFVKIKVDSYDSLRIEETLTLHNVIIRMLSQFLTKIKITIIIYY